jgi:hypothetical protein
MDAICCCAAGKPAWNLRSDSTVVGRHTRSELRSRRFRTTRVTRVVESLDAHSQHWRECDVINQTNTFVYVVVVVLSKGYVWG